MKSIPRYRQPAHYLRSIPPPVLRAAQWLVLLATRLCAARDLLFVFLVYFPVQRSRVKEQQLGVELQQVGSVPENLFLNGVPVRLQEIHRPVQVL